MKPPFYTLPKAERSEILVTIERLHNEKRQCEEQYKRYTNLAANAKDYLNAVEAKIKEIQERYDWN